MEYANCFISKSFSLIPQKSNPSRCKLGGITITGLAKLLAFGDFLKAKASQRNATSNEILNEEIAKYPYSRKNEYKVR